MKALTILATIAIPITSCNCKKKATETNVVENKTVFPDQSVVTSGKVTMQQNEVPTLYYEATSRGVFLSIKVENQTLFVSKTRDFKEYEVAAHANITFESKGVKYPANGFDHGFPPAEVAQLVNKITKLAEQE